MNTYAMVLYWQNKALIMEKEVRKAQRGITRLKRREKYLLECIDSNNRYYESILNKLEKENKQLNSYEQITEETIKRHIGL